VVQVDVGDQATPKLISKSESLLLDERQKSYIDVLAWSYKYMSDLESQVTMHHLNTKMDAKPLKQK